MVVGRKVSRISKAQITGRDSEAMYNIDDGSVDEESDFLSSHRCSMVKRYNMPTFFSPDKIVSSRTTSNYQASPSQGAILLDSINVDQPGTMMGMVNETIVEETGEADESQIMNTRFSQRFKDEEDALEEYKHSQQEYQQRLQQDEDEDEESIQKYHRISNVIQDLNLDGGVYQQETVMHNYSEYTKNNDYQNEGKKQFEKQKKQPEQQTNFIQQKKNKLDAFVTKMPMPG